MIKRILLTIVMLLLIAYLVAAVTVFNDKPAHQVCRDMELVIKDTLNAGFVTKNEVAAILQKKRHLSRWKRKWTGYTPKHWKKSWINIHSSMKLNAIKRQTAKFAWK